jgi:hypothetical protein
VFQIWRNKNSISTQVLSNFCERTTRDEPVGVVIYIYICIETIQGNSLCSYFYLKLTKTSCFSFYLSTFFFYKIEDEKGGTTSAHGEGGSGTGGRGKVAG